MRIRAAVAFFAFLAALVVASTASADEALVSGYLDCGIGMRTISYRGLQLTPGGEPTSRFALDGREIAPALASALAIGAGLRVGPIVGGVDIGVSLGGLAHGPTLPYADIEVRPSGFGGAMNVGTHLGVVLHSGSMRVRLMGTLGTELAAIGMERPGFAATAVSAMNAERMTAGPRVHVEWPFDSSGGSVGFALGFDALHPTNAFAGFVVSTL